MVCNVDRTQTTNINKKSFHFQISLTIYLYYKTLLNCLFADIRNRDEFLSEFIFFLSDRVYCGKYIYTII